MCEQGRKKEAKREVVTGTEEGTDEGGCQPGRKKDGKRDVVTGTEEGTMRSARKNRRAMWLFVPPGSRIGGTVFIQGMEWT